ncbi:hypothetical protein BKA70DRAFT_1426049 [Coprinopsis sp. MPI-PUGE-AT-0042]|nr:hypothetical protein BKA70DRAFT_1230651 [Coprinopsis sp. MPI-PUGE-AT-0042]KAH6909631.1 hypothetical protein BKA70DRAFT_1426049 [Coprinopsis sp. MPI-PUGE-AT-0042]
MASSVPSTGSYEGPWPVIHIPAPINAVLFDDFGANLGGEMCRVHNIYIRSLNSMWYCAPLVTPEDLPAFIGYSKTALEMVQEHHDGEEMIIFPALASGGLASMVEENVEGHKEFHEAMEVLEAYLKTVEKNLKEYDSVKMRELLKKFGDPLVKHLHDEIPTVQPDIIQTVDRKVLDKISKDFEAHIKSQGGFTTTMPFALSGHNMQDGEWPPIPAALRWTVKNVLSRVNSSWWKFAAYDFSGKPQTYKPSE